MAEKVKISNPNAFRVGLKLMDGVREVVVPPKKKGAKEDPFIYLDADEVYFINNMSTTFQRKMLIVHDKEINQNLGLETEDDIAFLNDAEIEEILKGNFMQMKKKLGEINDKHLINRIIRVAQGIEDLAQGKVKYLAEISGYEIDQIVSKDEDE
jgi:hypothetical protein